MIDELVTRARALAEGTERSIIGIVGAPGSGKTTLVERLLAHLHGLPVAHVPMDGFHLADVTLDRLGLRQHKGAPQTFDVDGYAALLHRIRLGRIRLGDTTVYAPGFERTLEQPIAASIAIEPQTRLVLTEGNYLLLDDPRWRRVRAQIDEVWYVDAPHAERRTRLVARHEQSGKSADEARDWVERVDEANARLVMATRQRADRVVDMAG